MKKSKLCLIVQSARIRADRGTGMAVKKQTVITDLCAAHLSSPTTQEEVQGGRGYGVLGMLGVEDCDNVVPVQTKTAL